MSQSQQTMNQQREQVTQMLEAMDPNSPIAATTIFRVNRGQQSAFERISADLVTATLSMQGIEIFDYLSKASLQPRTGSSPALQYLIYEKWDSVSDYLRQWNSDHFMKFQSSALDMVNDPPVLTCYRASHSTARVLHPRFVDNSNGTVTDRLTGLIWLQNANLYGEVPWQTCLDNARNLCSGSAGLTDGSKAGDWRLPNVNEFQSLLNLNNTSGPSIAPDHPFMNLHPSNYWTSTSVALAPALGWFVALAVGPPVFDLKMNSMRMWPVRGGQTPRIAQTGQTQCFGIFGQPMDCSGTGQDADIRAGIPFPQPRFVDNRNGTVTDRLTGLIWLKNANVFGTRKWQHALDACNSLGAGSDCLDDNSKPGDWRLPNLFELRSLMDYSTFNPSLSEGHPFDNVIPSLYWSSTTVASAPNLARFVFVGVGPSVWDHKSVLLHVWPVRGGVLPKKDMENESD